jgi:hypothetical protein
MTNLIHANMKTLEYGLDKQINLVYNNPRQKSRVFYLADIWKNIGDII